MTQVKNFTPHPISVVNAEGETVKVFTPEGLVRLKATTEPAGFEVDGVPVTKTVFGEPEGLPEPQEGIFLIVSQIVKTALPQRADLLVPAEVVRDSEGKILGCKSLGV